MCYKKIIDAIFCFRITRKFVRDKMIDKHNNEENNADIIER